MTRLWNANRANPSITAGTIDGGAGDAMWSDYIDRLAKLVPSEVLAVYVAMNALAPDYRRIEFFIGILLVPTYLVLAGGAGTAKKLQVTLSSGAFAVWALAMYGQQAFPQFLSSQLVALLLLVYTFLAPLLLKRFAAA